ncbi:IpaC/SipC family type III secretion system effector [Solimicrobium silvestre]|uniref:Effector protein BipC n=1 Tax=Solimicrobium silvestre TaxID=2099400 RepID=A0A2S9H1P1_9BURK|nr:IpaC/SipC family type III secretion system effector [Solimicrobium silvestre]PRC93870.1 Salmonella-Shigella invasin protein C [Solimicrobium silvestre]
MTTVAINNQVSFPLQGGVKVSGLLGANDVANAGIGNKKSDPFPLALVRFDEDGDSDNARIRNDLSNALVAMSPERKGRVISNLTDMAHSAAVAGDSKVVDALKSKLPDVEKEARNGNSFDHLLELLFMLITLLGQANTARKNSAAKFGEIAFKQVQIAGANNIAAASANLAGSLSGMVIGVATGGVGFGVSAKATGNQVKNIKTNRRDTLDLRQKNNTLSNAINRPTSPSNGQSAQDKVRKLDAQGKELHVQENLPGLTSSERAVLSQPLERTNALIDSKQMVMDTNTQQFALQQQGGHLISSYAMPLANVAQAGAGVDAASKTSTATIVTAGGNAATTMQHSDDEISEQTNGLLAKMFALINSLSKANVNTLNAVSQSIKA